MTGTSKLRKLTGEALQVLRQTRAALAEMQHVGSERTATSLPLVLASMDTAEAIYELLINRPEQSWVAAMILQRAQMEYVLRSAFFAKAASLKEVARFRRTGEMPKRGKSIIHVANVTEEAAQQMGWDQSKLLATVKGHYKELSGLVHGAKEVLAIYTQHEEWGDITINWDDLLQSVDNILVFVQLAIAVAMALSPLDPKEMDRAIRPSYTAAREYFSRRKAR